MDKDHEGWIISSFEHLCWMLACAVNEQLFKDPTDPYDNGREFYWIADEIGGLCDFGNGDILSCTEMQLILEKDVTYEQYEEWKIALLDRPAGAPIINLKSWLMGARYKQIEQ